ncbi:TPA: hypothetical protein ACT5CR_002280 [Burkholderia cenocepacia]|uniref:hypothetical protein n=1 Tax=Burkholderia cepacia complex TaxID=87882 RepID=UPI0009B202BC|nr:hypothetical protein [Burkholderia cenocepacia]MCW3689322.1 hypothetical protein [Burkholderia cenocepacia]MEB2610616.1 hypothetical protein [Burkholderia cenocepacia]QUN38855.1 hypothetical protein KEH56_11695 [Burkholderia cenocepacia]QUO29245.1 hypothetical protein KEH57_22335 [Burkholderia cenocepacia]
MNLGIANTWLEREHVGFSDIHEFASRCRDAAVVAGRESAALVLLAESATAFTERYEGIAISVGTVDEFLGKIRMEAKVLKEASKISDAALLKALNDFSAKLAPTIFV